MASRFRRRIANFDFLVIILRPYSFPNLLKESLQIWIGIGGLVLVLAGTCLCYQGNAYPGSCGDWARRSSKVTPTESNNDSVSHCGEIITLRDSLSAHSGEAKPTGWEMSQLITRTGEVMRPNLKLEKWIPTKKWGI